MDKVQKIRKEVERLKSQLLRGACSSQIAMENRCKEEAYNEVLAILGTMQEEPVIEDAPSDDYVKGFADGRLYEQRQKPVTSVWHDVTTRAFEGRILWHSTYNDAWMVMFADQINWNVCDKWAYIEDILKL